MDTPIKPLDSLRRGWRMTEGSYWLFFAVCFVGLVVGGAIPILLTGPLTCGIFRCYFAKAKGRRVSFELLFQAFDVFVPSAIACGMYTVVLLGATTVLGSLIILCTGIITYGVQAGSPIVMTVAVVIAALLLLVLMACSLLTTIAWLFSCALIEGRQMDGWTAYVEGLRIVWAQPKAMMRYAWVHYILSLAGSLACCVGLFFVAPILFGSLTHVYGELYPDDGGPPALDEKAG